MSPEAAASRRPGSRPKSRRVVISSAEGVLRVWRSGGVCAAAGSASDDRTPTSEDRRQLSTTSTCMAACREAMRDFQIDYRAGAHAAHRAGTWWGGCRLKLSVAHGEKARARGWWARARTRAAKRACARLVLCSCSPPPMAMGPPRPRYRRRLAATHARRRRHESAAPWMGRLSSWTLGCPIGSRHTGIVSVGLLVFNDRLAACSTHRS